MRMLRSSIYTSIADRRTELDRVRSALSTVLRAEATTLTPEDRASFIVSILQDLWDYPRSEADDGAQASGGAGVWQVWPEELRCAALETVKVLGRNPVGSEALGTEACLRAILAHSGLADLSLGLSSKTCYHPNRLKSTKQAISILANSLRLHPMAAKRTVQLGGGQWIVRILCGRKGGPTSKQEDTDARSSPGGEQELGAANNTQTRSAPPSPSFTARSLLRRKSDKGTEDGQENNLAAPSGFSYASAPSFKVHDTPVVDTSTPSQFQVDLDEETVFLLGRCLFLLTAVKGDFVRAVVDDTYALDGLTERIQSLRPVPASYAAMTELLKTVYHLVVHYPAIKGSEWDEKLDCLLPMLLQLLFTLPQEDILPPTTNVINALTRFPFTSKLRPIWHQAYPLPVTPSPQAMTATSATPASEKSARRTFIDRLGNPFSSSNSNPKSEERLSPTRGMSGTPNSSSSSASTSGFHLGRRRSSSSAHSSVDQALTAASGSISIPQRLLNLLNRFFDHNLPPLPWVPGDAIPAKSGLAELELDEILPAVLLLLSRTFEADEGFRKDGMDALFPSTLDRSPESTPLERRPGLLGNLLRVLGTATSPLSSTAAGEMFWCLCGQEADALCEAIGYGNGAGLLFMKGLSAPSDPNKGARVEELPEDDYSSRPTRTITTTNMTAGKFDPITSLQIPSRPLDSTMSDMTPQEKEREAERLMTLFDRMARNPAMGVVENPMRAAVESGRADGWGAEDEVKERERVRKEEEKEESEAMRDLDEYKKRKARTG